MTAEPWRAELEALLAAHEAGTIDDAGWARLQELLRDDEALDVAIDQLEVDALLQWQHGLASETTEPVNKRPVARIWRLLAAAALVVALIGAALWDRGEPTGPLDEAWVIEGERAEFQITGPRTIRLVRGELHVRSARSPAPPLAIETPLGDARAEGTAFYIGTHKAGDDLMSHLTRVLVLTGTVTLTNALGTAQAGPGELVVAQQGKHPAKVVAAATGNFGFDLYRGLVRDRADENFALSPFSIMSAVAMAVEGARGETATEMAKALRWPAAAARIGDDPQRLPFELSRIRNGFTSLNHILKDHSADPEQRALRERVAALEAALPGMYARWRAARRSGDPDARALMRKYQRADKEHAAKRDRIKSYRLDVANAIWGDARYPFAPDYVTTVRDAYGAEAIMTADFARDSGREIARINAWVRKQTQARIDDLVGPSSIGADTRLVILNAVYMKADWLTPFEPGNTRPLGFTTATGATAKTPTMVHYGLERCRYGAFRPDGSLFPSPRMIKRGQKEGLYPARGGFQVLELPYRGGDLAMVIVLPRHHADLGRIERSLTGALLRGWLGKLEQRKTYVRLPRFRSESSFDLRSALEALGMRRAFRNPLEADGADFSGMSASSSPADRLYVGRVAHKVFVAVDEAGTEAGGVTAMDMAVGAAAPDLMPFVPLFQANRPFVYVIRDVRTGTPLFVGRFVRP